MIKSEDLEEVKELCGNGDYFDFNLVDLGRMAPIWEIVIKTSSGRFYKAVAEFDEGDYVDFDEDEFCEVVPREVVKIEYVDVEGLV